ncbi:MAG: PilW family protein [Gammaproteobacteria bacterium]
MTRTMQKGFSVVELMVALVLGLFLVSGVTAMYISSKQSYRMTDNLSRLQESLRFSLEYISNDVRMAGYMPCRFPPLTRNVMDDSVTGDATTGTDAWFLDYFDFGIQGYEGGVTAFPPHLPAVGTNAGDRVAGADAIVVLKGSVYTSSVDSHDATTNTFTLQNNFTLSDFDRGRIAIACDPRQASIFQVSAVDETARTINYTDVPSISPGNANTNIGSFGPDAQITSYQPVVYYLANSTQNPSVRSLKRQYFIARTAGLNEVADMREEELLEGVESMQILYGEDTLNNDLIVDRYVTANNVTDWQNVITVRIGLLMASGEQITAQVDTNAYNVAGTLISDTSTPAHGGDRRLRYVANTTINLRNRVAN